MHRNIENAIDEIDAALFSSDTFENDKYRLVLFEILKRWQREIKNIDTHHEQMTPAQTKN